MAALVCVVLILAMVGASDGAWCVCRSDVGDSSLQKTLDYACGNGADCSTIQQGGACFNPNNVRSHCSYAVNSYFQKKGQTTQACDFSGTATLATSDPSANGCTYPASASGSTNTPTGTTTTTPPGSSSTTPTGTTTTSPPGSSSTVPVGSTTPSTTFSPPSGLGTGTGTGTGTGSGSGGVLGGLGPSGTSFTDPSHASSLLPNSKAKAFMASSLVFLILMLKG